MKPNPEFDNFKDLMDRLAKVPHSELKAKLEEEKRKKKDAKEENTEHECIDLENAEKELAHLREAANSKSDMLIQFAEWLRVSPERHLFRSGASIHHGFDVEPLPERYMQVLDIKSILNLANDIRKTHRRILDLTDLSRL